MRPFAAALLGAVLVAGVSVASAQPVPLDGPGGTQTAPSLNTGGVVLDGPGGVAMASWNLDGAGKFLLDTDEDGVLALGPMLRAGPYRVDVAVSMDGLLSDCRAANGQVPAAVVAQLCPVLAERARFARNPRMEVPLGARLTVSAQALDAVVPMLPIRVVGQGERGVPVTLTEQSDGSCAVSARVASGHDREICAAWQAAGRPGLVAGAGRLQAQFQIAEGFIPGYQLAIGAAISQTGPARSSLGDPDPAARLTNADGQLSLAIASEDYPTRALRDGLAGRVVAWIGFDRAGVARRCRPVESSNSAYLANASCDVVLRRARYAFAAGHAPFEGLRYTRASVVWTLP